MDKRCFPSAGRSRYDDMMDASFYPCDQGRVITKSVFRTPQWRVPIHSSDL